MAIANKKPAEKAESTHALPIPKGLDLDGKKDGEEISILLTAKIAGSTLVPLSLDGVPVGESMPEDAEEAPEMPDEVVEESDMMEEAPLPSEGSFREKLQAAVGG